MTRKNRRPGPCARCQAHVAAHAGTLQGPPWTVLCATCLPPAPETPPTARLELDGAVVVIRLTGGYAGRERFDAFRAACKSAGARPRKTEDGWRNECDLARAPEAIAALRRVGGLLVDADQAVTDALESAAKRHAAAAGRAEERLAAMNAELAERGQALYAYQESGIRWLSQRETGLLADDMGLGKSVQALIAAPEDAPILVICPAVAKGVWLREASKWRPDLRAHTLAGRGSFRWPEPGELVATNFDILPDDAGAAPAGCVVIVDEAHALKNSKAQRTKRARKILKAARAASGRTYLLTATPLLNRPTELWALLQAAGETAAFGNFRAFARLMGGYQTTIRAHGGRRVTIWQWDGQRSPEAAERLRGPMLRRVKSEVLAELPAKRYQDIPAMRGAAASERQCRMACDAAADELDRWERERPGKLPPFEMLSAARAELARTKIPTMLATVEEYEESETPVVVFSAHRAPIDLLAQREGWAVITGDTSAEERTRIEEKFQRGELSGVGATIKAGGVAITLTAASHALFVDLDWTPALNSQAEDRIHRIGQEGSVLIQRIVSDHALDARIFDLLADKSAMVAESVDAARRGADESETPTAEALESAADMLRNADEQTTEALKQIESQREAHESSLARIEAEIAESARNAEERRWLSKVAQSAGVRGIDLMVAGDRDPGERRGPETDREAWAAQALVQLSALDTDHASFENFVGWNKADGSLGHELARRLQAGGLTDLEWRLATVLPAKYHRQVGPAPEEAEQR